MSFLKNPPQIDYGGKIAMKKMVLIDLSTKYNAFNFIKVSLVEFFLTYNNHSSQF